jgi:hypothetical protein
VSADVTHVAGTSQSLRTFLWVNPSQKGVIPPLDSLKKTPKKLVEIERTLAKLFKSLWTFEVIDGALAKLRSHRWNACKVSKSSKNALESR